LAFALASDFLRPSVIPTTLTRLAAATALATLVVRPAAAQQLTIGPVLPASSPFRGGVPQGSPTSEPVFISIGDAIRRALEHNLGVLEAEERIERARGARALSLSELLPQVNGNVSESRRKTNLEAFGFPLRGEFPRIVGPFNVFDARVFVSQSLVDLAAVRNNRAESHNLAAARHEYRSAQDLVMLVAANLYLEALAATARVDTARAQFETAQALYSQAQDLRTSGLVAGLDVIRAEVRLSSDRQRVTIANNDLQKGKLQLARVIGLPVGQEFMLSPQLPLNVPFADMTLDQALERAYRQRPDYLAAQERVRAAEVSLQAVRSERLPAVRLNADYGAIGLEVGSALPTFNVTAAVSVPIFEGGRIEGRALRAQADLKQRQAEAEDLRAGLYYDVRTALLDLQATDEQLQTASRTRDLAAQQLTQSRDRFAAGVASNVEVIQAQEAVTLAAEQYISALYGFNIAKAMLAESVGSGPADVERLLNGQ
jgi:outer membrane protein TolC